jgi:short-subunit dehydrogenase
MLAIVTGATKGIGRAITFALAEKQYNLAICSRNLRDLQEIKEELVKKYPKIKILTKDTDMRKPSDVASFSKLILDEFPSVDVLVNNAGVFIPGMTHLEDEGTLEYMIETNLYSAYHLTRALLPKMIEQKSGHIFNMCSVASKIAYPNGGSYSISKFALLGFTKVLREELKDKGIKVTAILPGATWSHSWAGVDLPKARLMESEDIAKIVSSALELSPAACIEEIIVRPQEGDL